MGRKKRNKNKLSEADSSAPPPDDLTGTFLEPQAFVVDTSPVFGRYLKTKTHVAKGTVILTDDLLCAGPLRSSKPVCLGCHIPLTCISDSCACSACGWPLCGKTCQKAWFHAPECEFFVKSQIKVPSNIGDVDFGAFAVLRGLLLKLTNAEGWKKLNTLQHHNEIRTQLPLWQENHMKVVKFLIEDLRLGRFFTDHEAHNVCGIFEVNGFELGQTVSFRGLFPVAAMMAHNCIPNAIHTDDLEEGRICIRAATDLEPDTPVTICYAFSLQASQQRQEMLMATKFFECKCPRCVDPYELGTHFSTLVCPYCRSPAVINTLCQDNNSDWRCSRCCKKIQGDWVRALLKKFSSLKDASVCIKDSEELLKDMSKHFHSQHYLPFEIKFNLCQKYGRESPLLLQLPERDLDRKIQLCTEVLGVLNVILPGFTVSRGLVLYELQAAESTKLRRIFESKKFSRAILRRKLEKVETVLVESMHILLLSPVSSPEYALAMSIKNSTLPDLQAWIKVVRTK